MEIVRNEEKIIEYGTTVALGNFDGVHLGHRELINTTISLAKASDTTPSVLTFGYDFNEFKLGKADTLLMSKLQKEEIFSELGIELLYILGFCDEIKNMSPEEFVKTIILKRLNVKTVIVGFNFRFGYKAKGDCKTLSELSEKYGFKVVIIPPIIKDDNLVSSTLIRRLITQGDLKNANRMLNRNYNMRGKVISGKGRGKKLGFATANLMCDIDYVSPRNGVYKTMVNYEGKDYKSITNIGTNPTFSDVGMSIETHIIDFDKDIYGEFIEVEFLDFVRKEKKFNGIEELIEQVNKDIEEVKRDDK